MQRYLARRFKADLASYRRRNLLTRNSYVVAIKHAPSSLSASLVDSSPGAVLKKEVFPAKIYTLSVKIQLYINTCIKPTSEYFF